MNNTFAKPMGHKDLPGFALLHIEGGKDAVILTKTEAINIAEQLLAITGHRNAANPKETTNEAPSGWYWNHERGEWVDEFAQPQNELARRQSQLISELQEKNRKLTQENHRLREAPAQSGDWKDRHDRMQELCAEADATIAMLSQQLQDKRDIIRKLTA